jgi:hypothetical protein
MVAPVPALAGSPFEKITKALMIAATIANRI